MGNLIKDFKKCILIVSLVAISFILISGDSLEAYNMKAKHKVNQDLDMKEEKRKIWIALRKLGYSEAATAGIMGNWMQESGCNRTVTQNHVPWSRFRKGLTGLGLAQWTYYTRQDALFKMADSMGTQWTDLDVQIALFEKEMKNCSFSSVGGLKGFKKLNDVDKATVVFENVYERAGVKKMSNRKKYAREIYNTYKGTSINSQKSKSGSTKKKVSSKKNTKKLGKEVENHNNITNTYTAVFIENSYVDYNLIMSEWDLVGMPVGEGLMSSLNSLYLPDKNYMSAGDIYSISILKNDLLDRRAYNYHDLLRTSAVFLGLCLQVYGVLVAVSYLFDKTNNLFEVSLLKIVTLGRLSYLDGLGDKKESPARSRVVKITLVCIFVGFIIISGTVYSWLLKVIYWFGEISSF